MTIDFKALRAANIQRQAEWPGSDAVGSDFRALEVADEVGEVAGAVKKLIRAQRGVAGTVAAIADVADEIGDAIIAMDLLAIETGVEMPLGDFANVRRETDLIRMALTLDAATGAISEAALLLTHVPESSEAAQWAQSDLRDATRRAMGCLFSIAVALGVEVDRAIAEKFNKTSAKYGLQTTMEAA